MVIRFRPHFAPSILLGFFLWLAGAGVVRLVMLSLASRSAATGLGELAVALLLIFVRIWRMSEGSRWVAGIFAFGWYPRVWIPDEWESSRLDLIHAFALTAISSGLWRAQPWARWAAALASLLSSIQFVRILTDAYVQQRHPLPMLSGESVLIASFAAFWAGIAVYLCLPSTGERLAEMRSAREGVGKS